MAGGSWVRSFDATVISEPGSTDTDWCIHYSLGLFDLYCHEFLATDPSTGEKIRNFMLETGDFIVADRAYWLRSITDCQTSAGFISPSFRNAKHEANSLTCQ